MSIEPIETVRGRPVLNRGREPRWESSNASMLRGCDRLAGSYSGNPGTADGLIVQVKSISPVTCPSTDSTMVTS